MGMPRTQKARQYYRCAIQRLDEAKILARAVETIGPVYLLGYAVECILKALIFHELDEHEHKKMERSFRESGHGHNFSWLRQQYHLGNKERFIPTKQPALPVGILPDFTHVTEWTTELRYNPRHLKDDEFDDFLAATVRIVKWATGRM